ncbi:PBP1A family penicillin-binding protein [Heliobacterium chlorum]|uniref:Penicillin-binding protein 1A n=1 Tax=Heliobacterium chlorum TaxID=2698 RepID=A0ABR7T0A0_HELCL|nr:PBP1A family penicillin-binding protein [Heliobacterium chlorum]MBC9783101.1 PBP1A family penicillin-binding protein [Heliobacterium chlorum]
MFHTPERKQGPNRDSPSHDKGKPSSLRRWIQVVTVITFFILLAGIGTLTYFLNDCPELNAETLGSLEATSFVYDKDGELITVLHGEQNRIPISLDSIPLVMQNAMLAAEDLRFYDHQGVDFRAILRALVTNFQDGRYSQGASTITQQLVKNTFLSTEKTIKRKIQEAFLAYRLESRFSKHQILELYLNRIYFGHSAYGVQAAAQTYFGKDASMLNLAEAAMIASIPRRPGYYSPITNPEAVLERRNLILSIMSKNNMISTAQAEEAKKESLPHQIHGVTQGRYPYGAFVDYVINELSNHGYSEDQVFRGGLKIYTSLDRKIQQRIEDVMNDDSNYPPGPSDQPVQASVAIIDHKTGEIKGLGGGRNYDGRRSFNRATQLRRQPGSALKPIVVYGPAMEAGYTPDDILVDAPIDFDGYSPGNYDNRYRGPVTIREAVAYSLNVPAVYLFKLMGMEKGIQFAKNVGLPLTDQDRYLSLALGGMTQGVSPLQMAGAYTPLANMGTYVEPHAVTLVIDAQGKELPIEYKNSQVMSSSAAYRTTQMLVSTVQSGTGYRAQMRHPVAGKTGTTELPPTPEFQNMRGNKDAWFVGYTPKYTCAVWMGYDKTDNSHYLKQIYGGSYPAQMFREIMNDALQNEAVEAFHQPEDYEVARAAKFIGPKNYDWSPRHRESPGPPSMSPAHPEGATEVITPSTGDEPDRQTPLVDSEKSAKDKPVKKVPETTIEVPPVVTTPSQDGNIRSIKEPDTPGKAQTTNHPPTTPDPDTGPKG